MRRATAIPPSSDGLIRNGVRLDHMVYRGGSGQMKQTSIAASRYMRAA
jgi:hypothetical protein